VSEALSTELQQLQQQVESERQQLSQLQQQRSTLELQAQAAASGQHVPRPSEVSSAGGSAAGSGNAPAVDVSVPGAAGGAADEVSPQSVYLECTEHQHDSQQQQHETRSHHVAAAAAAKYNADAAVQCEDGWLQLQAQMGGREALAQCADAACQAMLLHVSGLLAVGPPIECRACPVLHKQLRQTQQRLEAALEQHKQVRHCSARLTTTIAAGPLMPEAATVCEID
jgi:hypothetical protein